MDDHSHYVFTPRDLTQWVLGLIRYPLSQDAAANGGSGLSSQDVMLEMWAYEARRLFRDRLVGEKAVDQFEAILGSVLQSDWSASLSSLDQDGGAFYVTWGSLQSSKVDGGGSCQFGRPLGRLSAADMQEVVAKAVTTFGKSHSFSPSLSPYSPNTHRVYSPSLILCSTVGRENQELDIVLFYEVLDHIARFDRVLTSPGGSLLLSGRSGVGRRTALLLTAHMHQIEIVTPHISRNYGLKQFKNDLKAVSLDGVLLHTCTCL